MKYVKLALGVVAVAACAAALWLMIRLGREMMMGGASLLAAMGDETPEAEMEMTPPPTPQPVYTPLPFGSSGGGIDPAFDPALGLTSPHPVYETEGLDLFEVPVDQEADMADTVP